MSIDLIGYVRDAITPDAVANLSSTLGESAPGIQKALEGGVPAILAGMAGKTSTGEGIASLLSLFRTGVAESGLLTNFGRLLNSSGAATLMDFGHEVVQSVLGDKAPTVADAISSQSGVRLTSALSLLRMAGPLAMGAISKASGSQGVTVYSLLNILSSQREAIARFLPAGLGGVLGGESLSSAAAFTGVGVITPGSTGDAANATVNMDNGPIQHFWPLLVVLALFVIAGLVWSINQETSPVPEADQFH